VKRCKNSKKNSLCGLSTSSKGLCDQSKCLSRPEYPFPSISIKMEYFFTNSGVDIYLLLLHLFTF